jgi:hypothetical protein
MKTLVEEGGGRIFLGDNTGGRAVSTCSGLSFITALEF